MIEVVSIKFKNRGKSYFFSPNGLTVRTGDKVIVDTAKGMEIADCSQGNHAVEDAAVVPPLRVVLRIATADDLRIAELNRKREQEAYKICQKKIAEHGLDMKLVDVECSFEGNKTTFYFTAEGRVDFRELVKDLASIFRNRIELRQIGVRDEAKKIGGIGICGRPYCCSQFLEDFQPVSTKMAKVQSLSLNPTKISGSCGRLMCCLRYEQEAYEELLKHVPKQGAFVETIDGYGTAVQVNLLRQSVKVRLDGETDDSLHLYKANELAAVPGGRPKDGEEPPHVLQYVPPEPEEEEPKEDEWAVPVLVVPEPSVQTPPAEGEGGKKNRRRRSGRGKGKPEKAEEPAQPREPRKEPPKAAAKEPAKEQPREQSGRRRRGGKKDAPPPKPAEGKSAEQKTAEPKLRKGHGKSTVKPVKLEAKPAEPAQTEGGGQNRRRRRPRKPRGEGGEK